MANQHTKRKEQEAASVAVGITRGGPPVASSATEEMEADAKRNREAKPAAREPEPIPDGNLFTVQAFGQDGKRVESAEASLFGGKALAPCSHADAVTACGKANESKIAETGAVWFGVVGVES
jgi:hypothetical protein